MQSKEFLVQGEMWLDNSSPLRVQRPQPKNFHIALPFFRKSNRQ